MPWRYQAEEETQCQSSIQSGEVFEVVPVAHLGFPPDAKHKYKDAYCNDFAIVKIERNLSKAG